MVAKIFQFFCLLTFSGKWLPRSSNFCILFFLVAMVAQIFHFFVCSLLVVTVSKVFHFFVRLLYFLFTFSGNGCQSNKFSQFLICLFLLAFCQFSSACFRERMDGGCKWFTTKPQSLRTFWIVLSFFFFNFLIFLKILLNTIRWRKVESLRKFWNILPPASFYSWCMVGWQFCYISTYMLAVCFR